MPNIRPISDLKNNADDIPDYEQPQARLELYAKLSEAEAEIAADADSTDFTEFAKKLRNNVHGTV